MNHVRKVEFFPYLRALAALRSNPSSTGVMILEK